MYLATYRKLQEQKMKLNRLAKDEEGDKKKKSLNLKVEEGKSMYEDMTLSV